MSSATPIPTTYRGYRFRSRLEARWALWLDQIGVLWEYEHQGYDLGAAGPYLPDFLIPANPEARVPAYFIEIKPDEPIPEELAKIEALALATGQWVNVFIGGPGHREHRVLAVRSRKPEHVNPAILAQIAPYYEMALERGEVLVVEALLNAPRTQHIWWGDLARRFLERWPDLHRSDTGRLETLIRGPAAASQERVPALCPSCGTLHYSYPPSEVPDMDYIEGADGELYRYCKSLSEAPGMEFFCQGCEEECDSDAERLKAAYLAARGARFEHGERP